MRTRQPFLFVLLTAGCLSGVAVNDLRAAGTPPAPLATAGAPSDSAPLPANYRYAYSCDGYNQNRDDIAASALTPALLDRAGRADRLVHFDFN